MSARWVGCLVAGALACSGLSGCKRDSSAVTSTSAAAPDEGGTVKVMVDDKGFAPSSVTAPKGKPLTLQFIRNSDSTCAKRVVVPELDLARDLPLLTPVDITIPTGEKRTLAFQCGMGMFKGSVIVD